MTFIKRMFLTLSAFIVLVVGSFSFMSAGALAAPSFDSKPFFVNMPQLPDGYFDGDLLANGDNYQVSLDFGNLSSSNSSYATAQGDASYTSHSEGLDKYSISFHTGPSEYYGEWSWDNGSLRDPNNNIWSPYNASNRQTNPNGEFDFYGGSNDSSGTISQTANGDESITGFGDDYSVSGSSDYSGTVSGSLTSSKDTTQHYRFRTWSVVGSYSPVEYFYYVCDARNTIRAVIDSSTSSSVTTYRYRIYTTGGYPFFRLRFNLDGTFLSMDSGSSLVVQFRSPTSTVTRGIWFSDNAPTISEFPSDFDSSGIYFCDAVFGKEALLFSYLHQLDSDLNQIHTDIGSLQTSMQSAISNQTTAFQNMDAASGFDPTSVSNMLEYGSLEATMQAPSTDDLFSLSGGTFTDGMGFWRDRMNEVLYFSGSPVLPMTIFVMTLGLAVLVIGRRVSGGGTA